LKRGHDVEALGSGFNKELIKMVRQPTTASLSPTIRIPLPETLIAQYYIDGTY